MKRHESLHPLTHHHHHTLVMAQKLKKFSDSDRIQPTTREVIDFWIQDGEKHFRDEEEVLLPLYAQYESVNQPCIQEMLIQHVEIRSYIRQIRMNQSAKPELFRQLGALLEKHVRLEERTIFPMIEQAVPENYLYQANGQYHRDSRSGF